MYVEISAETKLKLELHAKWLRGEHGGEKANLSWADLSGANLRGADLSGANLRGASLSGADLSGANLRGADLSCADLSGANLSGANLSRANLSRASLSRADLSGANLDFSSYPLWCGSLSARIDQKHAIQLLFHAAMPFQNNGLEIDADLKRLFKSESFIKVLQKFHRDDVEKYAGDIK